MERQVKVKIGGKEYHLLYSVSVLFDTTEKFGSLQKAIEAIDNENEKAGAEAVLWFALKMAEAGELARRYAGHQTNAIPSEKEMNTLISPLEYSELKNAVIRAISIGYMRDVENKEEIDMGLLELEEKKTADEAPVLSTAIPP